MKKERDEFEGLYCHFKNCRTIITGGNPYCEKHAIKLKENYKGEKE